MDARYSHAHYELIRQLFKLGGANLRILDPVGGLAFFVHQKAWKMKEDIRVFADEAQSQELFRIAARSIVDFSAAYDVFDSQTNQKIGGFKRKGMKSSFLHDAWVFFDGSDKEIGTLEENPGLMAILRRWVDLVSLFSPQSFTMRLQGQPVAFFKQNRNPFHAKLELHFPTSQLDKRIGIAAAVLIAAIEGKQH